MPFEIAPQEPEIKVGQFHNFAVALLAGCAATYPITGKCFDRLGGACAMGAVFVGLGMASPDGWGMTEEDHQSTSKMEDAYLAHYGHYPTSDNDSRRYTREQIAERIAAL